jgi:hypothetical protein
LDRRIVAQAGWFSVHKYAAKRDGFQALDEQEKFAKDLRRFAVPREAFAPLREQLRLLGVTSSSMFPDLQGLGADIEAEFIGSYSPRTTDGPAASASGSLSPGRNST